MEEAEARLPETQDWVRRVMDRLAALDVARPAEVLEIGAAQGRGLVALSRLGFRAAGVEPWTPAIEVARRLSERHGVRIDLREGRCEALPFESERFGAVLAFSVLEHVTDIHVSLREICRVLKPGGVLWFSSASAMSPLQQEIRFFPLFGWYPDRLKKSIMRWAAKGWPAAVNHTEAPALWWWTPRRARRWLRDAGFDEVWDRWQLRGMQAGAGRGGTLARAVVALPGACTLGDILVPGCSFAARKAPA